MNEQLQIELTKVITNINAGATSAWGFITDQTPDIVNQLLLWHGISSAVTCFIPMFLLCLTLYIFVKNTVNADFDSPTLDRHGVYSIIFGIISFILTPVTICNINLIWLKVWLAPKVWLLEYITSLARPITG